MAFQMNYTDEYGDSYEESYWRVVQPTLNKEAREGAVVFYGYQDADHKGKRIIGQKIYAIAHDDFDEYFSPDDLNPEGKNPWEASYRFATATLDTGPQEAPVSFFDGATAV